MDEITQMCPVFVGFHIMTNYEDTSDYNPLFLAVHNGETDLFNSLLEQYSATDTIHGKKLIEIAAARGHEKIVRLLTDKDTDINNLVHIAIEMNQPSVFHLLIKECDVNAKDEHGETLLHYAISFNRIEFAKILIENGAIVNAPNGEGHVPLSFALMKRSNELTEILFKGGAVLTEHAGEALSHAASRGNLEMVKLLMTNGMKTIDAQYSDYSPLYAAVLSGNLKVVEYLMENGSMSDNTMNKDRLGLLSLCINEGRLDILKYLIESGVKTKREFLKYCMTFKNYKIWKYLLTCRSKIDAETYFSETELHKAVRAGDLENVEKFVNDQANTVETDSLACRLAVYIAVENGYGDILQVLLDAGYSTSKCFADIGPLHLAATYEHTRFVEMLLKAGADLHSKTSDKFIPVDFALIAKRRDVVKFLIASDPKV